jgi:hypothetical protein
MQQVRRAKKRARRPLKARRQERELLFWTAYKALQLVALASLTAYMVVCLIEGRMPMVELLSRFL